MKQLLFISIFTLSIVLIGCSTNGGKENTAANADHFIIKGKIKGIEDGRILTLSGMGEESKLKPDSCVVKNGEFSFQGKIEEPTKVIIRVSGAEGKGFDKYLQFYLENANYQMETDYANFTFARFTGNSKANEAYNKLLDKTIEYKKIEESYRYKPEKKLSKEEAQKMADLSNEAYKKQMAAEKMFVLENPDSYPTLDILNYYNMLNEQARIFKDRDYINPSPMNDEELKASFQKLSDEIKNSSKGKALAMSLFTPQLKEGDKYEELVETYTLEGKPFKVSDIKTDYVLLDFTGVYCGWCKVFNKNMIPNYNKVKDKLTIVSFYTDNDKDLIIKSTEKEGINWLIVSDLKGDNSLNKQRYHVRGIPDFYLLDKDRKIIKHETGFSKEFVDYLVGLGEGESES